MRDKFIPDVTPGFHPQPVEPPYANLVGKMVTIGVGGNEIYGKYLGVMRGQIILKPHLRPKANSEGQLEIGLVRESRSIDPAKILYINRIDRATIKAIAQKRSEELAKKG